LLALALLALALLALALLPLTLLTLALLPLALLPLALLWFSLSQRLGRRERQTASHRKTGQPNPPQLDSHGIVL
jgi:hypothetical protein